MFTGIVEELGEVVAVDRTGGAPSGAAGNGTDGSARLRLRGPVVTEDAKHGDSIAVNGVCLTVTGTDIGTDTDTDTGTGTAAGEFTADVMAETLNRSVLGSLVPGSRVNLERPMALGGRLGGHLVQGHVDGTGTIAERIPGDQWEIVRITLPPRLARYVVEKGSITVDGVSLTVVQAAGDSFTISLIPTTLELTTLGLKQPGDPVNLEVDVLAKYVERLLGAGASTPEAAE